MRRAYNKEGVTELYEWQLACLQGTKALHGKSLVYSAPTSAGKTLVAEVLMARTLVLQGKRAIIVLPYISLVLEMLGRFRKIFEQV